MQEAAMLFLGEHDWTAFSAAQTETRTRLRTITELVVTERCDDSVDGRLVEIRASADGFLRYMVRTIAGTLLAIGRDEIDEEAINRAIKKGTRPLAATTAPPHGLTLKRVHYES